MQSREGRERREGRGKKEKEGARVHTRESSNRVMIFDLQCHSQKTWLLSEKSQYKTQISLYQFFLTEGPKVCKTAQDVIILGCLSLLQNMNLLLKTSYSLIKYIVTSISRQRGISSPLTGFYALRRCSAGFWETKARWSHLVLEPMYCNTALT